VAGADDGGSGMTAVDPPVPPKGLGLGMNTGDGDLLLIILLRFLRRVQMLRAKDPKVRHARVCITVAGLVHLGIAGSEHWP